MVRFYLENGRVVQSESPGMEHEFDPLKWGSFTRGSLVVHAVKIPRPFQVGAERCKDGHLVYESGEKPRLVAISASTFEREYRPLAAVAA